MIALKPVETVEIISLVDNLLEPTGVPARPEVKGFREWTPDPEHARSPRAEHGLSMLARVHGDFGTHSILLDVAYEPGAVMDNAARMGLDLSPVEAIVLSHQHYDHTGGLVPVLKALNARDLPVVVHPNTFTRRAWRDPAKPDARMRHSLPTPTRAEAEAAGARIVEAAGPYLLCDDAILITGNKVECLQDVGVAGLHRLLAAHDLLRSARVLIVVAGMEGHGLLRRAGAQGVGRLVHVVKAVENGEQADGEDGAQEESGKRIDPKRERERLQVSECGAIGAIDGQFGCGVAQPQQTSRPDGQHAHRLHHDESAP